jgi:hypothetical protein
VESFTTPSSPPPSSGSCITELERVSTSPPGAAVACRE